MGWTQLGCPVARVLAGRPTLRCNKAHRVIPVLKGCLPLTRQSRICCGWTGGRTPAPDSNLGHPAPGRACNPLGTPSDSLLQLRRRPLPAALPLTAGPTSCSRDPQSREAEADTRPSQIFRISACFRNAGCSLHHDHSRCIHRAERHHGLSRKGSHGGRCPLDPMLADTCPMSIRTHHPNRREASGRTKNSQNLPVGDQMMGSDWPPRQPKRNVELPNPLSHATDRARRTTRADSQYRQREATTNLQASHAPLPQCSRPSGRQ
mmetsp:Transcript_42147/g.111085  ORF Transcript_42147/g.111085 Transcript_42147/m.111085 type:complete len:263 (-) Transcript_42147:46-834(-)